jgi:hypothetical protein
MMISPENYYEEYLSGKDAKQINEHFSWTKKRYGSPKDLQEWICKNTDMLGEDQ